MAKNKRHWSGYFQQHRLIRLMVFFWGAVMALNIAVAISAPLETTISAENLREHLDELITLSTQPSLEADDNKSAQLTIIHDHLDRIIATPDLSIRAMILARQSDDLDLALKIGSAAIDHLNKGDDDNAQTPRLIYELANTLLLAGDCKRARPLFQVLVDEGYPAPQWIQLESRKGLILCPDGLRIFGDVNVEFSTDDNLAGLTPRQSITPQSGSAMARVIASLSPTISLPNEFNLGTPPQEGYWMKVNASLWRQWRQDQSILTARLRPSVRFTSPLGYEHLNLSGELSRHQIAEETIGIQSLALYRNLRQHGENQDQTEEVGVRLFSGVEWQTRYPFLIGASVGQGTSKTGDSKITINQYGYRLGIRSGFDGHNNTPNQKSSQKSKRWSLAYHHDIQDTTPQFNAQKSKSLSGDLGVFSIGPLDHVTLNMALIRSRPDTPRPWLSHRHVREDQIFGITSRHRIHDHWVDVVITYHRIRSDDPLDPDTNLRFTIRMD